MTISADPLSDGGSIADDAFKHHPGNERQIFYYEKVEPLKDDEGFPEIVEASSTEGSEDNGPKPPGKQAILARMKEHLKSDNRKKLSPPATPDSFPPGSGFSTPFATSPHRKGMINFISQKKPNLTARIVMELLSVFCSLTLLLSFLFVKKVKERMIWKVEVWKYCVLFTVILCGLFVTYRLIQLLLFLIANMSSRKKQAVIFFIQACGLSLGAFIWIVSIFTVWISLFRHRLDWSKKVIDCVTKTFVILLVASVVWIVKRLCLKILQSRFQRNAFFQRIQESIFNQYVFFSLSSNDANTELIFSDRQAEEIAIAMDTILNEEQMNTGVDATLIQKQMNSKAARLQSCFGAYNEVVDMEVFVSGSQKTISHWTMDALVNLIINMPIALNNKETDEGDKENKTEKEARNCSRKIFRKVAERSRIRYISKIMLLKFMEEDEVDRFLALIAQHSPVTKGIGQEALTTWMISNLRNRKTLSLALTDTKIAVEQLNKLLSGILIVIIFTTWLLLMRITTPQTIAIFSAAIAFMFGNAIKNVFEAAVFVFVVHPFDVGDRCVVDDVPLLVEEIGILTTVFLKMDSEKIYYPNSVLASKVIGNYNRSPSMVESVEFSIDFTTTEKQIEEVKTRIKNYINKHPKNWQRDYAVVVVKESEDNDKLKMTFYCRHTLNFQDLGEKYQRRTSLVIAIKKILHDLKINIKREDP